MQSVLDLLLRFFLILDVGQDSMVIFNISKESVRDTCIIGPESRVRRGPVLPALPSVGASYLLVETRILKQNTAFFSIYSFQCLIRNSCYSNNI